MTRAGTSIKNSRVKRKRSNREKAQTRTRIDMLMLIKRLRSRPILETKRNRNNRRSNSK